MPKSKQPEPSGSGLSRRDFFKGSTVGAVSSALLAGAEGRAQDGSEPLYGPGEVPIQLNVNGKIHHLQVEPRVTLLDALRNELDVMGAKRVCDRATCGACSVILDDKLVNACSVLAIEAQGKLIVTVEGLSSGTSELHPIQEAFLEHDAQQCGFCTPGFVVASEAFLRRNPNPSVEDIEKGLGGNLCRCGTYAGIRRAIMQTAAKGGFDA
jgi:xanthine dehydrogenase YagT iron-sulfur-binding subunit